MMNNSLKRIAAIAKPLLRIGLGLGLLAGLIWMNWARIAEIQAQQIRWAFFALALVINLAAILITLVRWYLLVVAQGLSFRLRDSMRIGFIGFLFSQVIPGAVSGDLV